MANFKKMDDKDFVFVNRPADGKEDREFSAFLKSRKALKNKALKRRKSVRKTKAA